MDFVKNVKICIIQIRIFAKEVQLKIVLSIKLIKIYVKHVTIKIDICYRIINVCKQEKKYKIVKATMKI